MHMKKIKIAYLLPSLSISGGVGVVLQHANRLQNRGYELFISVLGGRSSADWFPGQSVPVVAPAELPDDLDILVATHWSTSYEVINLKAKHKCYFVQSDETRFHEAGTDLFYMTHLSYLMNFHYLTEAKWIQKWLLENFDKNAELVPNGLDGDIFHPTNPIAERSKPRVLLEGPINAPLKGMKEAFEVVKDLDVEVWCISADGRPQPDWKCDRFFEKVPMTKMKEIYSSCDILLKLSRMEGFFGPPLEMMACGGVCVVGKVTGYDEYIIDEENALVVNSTDIEGARQALLRLISNEDLRESLRTNGLKTAASWDWESSVDILEKYYGEIADGKHGVFTPEREVTNDAILKLKSLSINAAIFPHEIILRKISSNKFFMKAAEKIFRNYTRWKSLVCAR
jgi:glycosyltransferase involved in cell wall biosynthesis